MLGIWDFSSDVSRLSVSSCFVQLIWFGAWITWVCSFTWFDLNVFHWRDIVHKSLNWITFLDTVLLAGLCMYEICFFFSCLFLCIDMFFRVHVNFSFYALIDWKEEEIWPLAIGSRKRLGSLDFVWIQFVLCNVF